MGATNRSSSRNAQYIITRNPQFCCWMYFKHAIYLLTRIPDTRQNTCDTSILTFIFQNQELKYYDHKITKITTDFKISQDTFKDYSRLQEITRIMKITKNYVRLKIKSQKPFQRHPVTFYMAHWEQNLKKKSKKNSNLLLNEKKNHFARNMIFFKFGISIFCFK